MALPVDQPPAMRRSALIEVLGGTPKELQCSTISDKAVSQSLSWLQTVVQGGLLDVAHELKNIASLADMDKVCRDWSERAIALTDFMDGIQVQTTTTQGTPSPLGEAFPKAHLGSTPEFKAFIAVTAERVASSYSEILSHAQHGEWARFTGMLDVKQNRCSSAGLAMGRWMAAASALDISQSVQKIAMACPLAHTVTFAFSALGEWVDAHRVMPNTGSPMKPSTDDVQITPFFVALQMSSLSSMTVLSECALPSQLTLGTVKVRGNVESFDLTTMHRHVMPACEPRAFFAGAGAFHEVTEKTRQRARSCP